MFRNEAFKSCVAAPSEGVGSNPEYTAMPEIPKRHTPNLFYNGRKKLHSLSDHMTKISTG